MGFFSVHQLAVAACRYRCCVALFRAFLVQVTAPTPRTRGRLLAVTPDMTELLAVVALREIAILLRLVSLNISWDFDVLDKVIRKRGMFTVAPARDRRVVDICLTLITSKPMITNPPEISSARAGNGRCRIKPLQAFVI
jgi:hypothetical protein